ncbi:T9SS type A sorting domain-containing protein [Polaribacter septentrionalilitoris]|uniref:T9SS type A sorting domain-containing protein n=1 Tax=Polaribacter septentrionalilitoris TaxID=2494657 RepID=UPI00135CE89E|nr:T9SS type A sorting domain-containing protein [Polaribacter septentrionalilitoris]
MKKITLKITAILFIALSAFQTNAQADAVWTKEGWYTLGAEGTDLLMTIDGATLTLIWAAPKTGADANLQEFRIVNHRTPSSAGLMEITADVTPGPGLITLTTNTEDPGPDATTGEKRALGLAIKIGAPKEVTPLVGDYSGLDQFQRRKTKVDADGNYDAGGSNPSAGNNALFLRTSWDNGSRFGVAPVAGEQVKFDNGAIDVIRFNFVKDLETASVNTFGAEAFSISNPINNTLTIKGATSKVSKINIFSVLGNKVLSKSVNNVNGDISFNTSTLSTGLYIVELTGANNERFTKKIIKQ